MTSPRLPREDLTAAMAARRELGPDYDEAFLEAVVNRIEETLDTRARPARRKAPAVSRPPGDHSFALAVLSLLAAIPLSAIAAVNAGVPGLLIALTAIVLINVAYRH